MEAQLPNIQDALARHRAGSLGEAEAIYHQVLAADPGNSDALHLLGLVMLQRGQAAQAVEQIRKAIAINPSAAIYHNNLGNALRQKGELNEAAEAFARARQLGPDAPEPRQNLANALKELLDRGNALRRSGSTEQAIACYRRIVALDEKHVDAYSNMGDALRELGRLEEAAAACARAIEVEPGHVAAHLNLGVVRYAQLRIDDAVNEFEKCLEVAPDDADVHWNLASALLLRGDFARGWKEFEWRYRHPDYRASAVHLSKPRWAGEDLHGKRILLWGEQGMGDVVQFIRYAPLVAQRGGTVMVQSEPPLRRLVERVQGVRQVANRGEHVVFDLQASLLSLPGIFDTTVETIPAEVPYLYVDRELIETWAARLADDRRRKVGLAWAGQRKHRDDRNRSMRPSVLAPLTEVDGISFYSLQKDQSAAELGHVVEVALDDFADTAALIHHLDLVITVDTAVAHLAGAMAKPVWTLLACAPDWRWLLDRSDSPWYPTMRLFRQPRSGDWTAVVAAVKQELENRRW